MSGTYVQAILSQKNWTRLAGVLRNGRNQSKYDFCSVGWPLLVKNPFFPFLVQIGPNHSEMVLMVQKWCLTVFYHLGPFLNDLDQLGSKTEKMGFLPKIANPQGKHSETWYFCFTWFVDENMNVPSRHTQKWHWNGLNIKKCHETTKITFDSYCETPCDQFIFYVFCLYSNNCILFRRNKR